LRNQRLLSHVNFSLKKRTLKTRKALLDKGLRICT